MEFGVKSFPAIYLIIAASVRLYRINHIGIETYRPSRTFYCKIVLSLFIGTMLAIYTIAVIAMPSYYNHTAWISQCD